MINHSLDKNTITQLEIQIALQLHDEYPVLLQLHDALFSDLSFVKWLLKCNVFSKTVLCLFTSLECFCHQLPFVKNGMDLLTMITIKTQGTH